MNYYNEIKSNLINNEAYRKVKDYSKNKNDLDTYYKVGKLLSEAGKHYGKAIIKEYSIRLSNDVNKKYTKSSLYNMIKYYDFCINFQTMSGKLTFSHYCELFALNDATKITYYVNISISQNLSVRELRNRIKNKEYERLPEEAKNKLITKEETNVSDLIKNPILIKNSYNYKDVTEKLLKDLILEDIEGFMNELGNKFSFIGSEYKIKIGDNYNYIDLLLYNIEFNCYVVVELKVTELKKEHIGQIEVYMNYMDNIKDINQNKTVGIIICKKDNRFILEYISDKRILAREYSLINV